MDGRIFSDVLYPDFIDEMNEILKKQKIEYNVDGMRKFAKLLRSKVEHDDILLGFTNELESWLVKAI